MLFEHKEQEYEVGVSNAYLWLSLEGCETTLGSAFGERVLDKIVEEDSVETRSSMEADASLGASAELGPAGQVSTSVGASVTRSRTLSQNIVHLPVAALPNDSWEVRPQKVTGASEAVLEGTAIPSTELCSLRRKKGGNRIAIVGEVQVSKSAFKVLSKRGNRLGKTMSEWQNKDAIVSQILKKAIQREASSNLSNNSTSAVAISRCEVFEE